MTVGSVDARTAALARGRAPGRGERATASSVERPRDAPRRGRWAGVAALLQGACLVAAGGPGTAWAQPAREDAPQASEARAPAVETRTRGMPEVDPDCDRADRFGGSALERAAFCALREEAFASVRTLAKRALEADPESFRAHFLLGKAQHEGEGNLPKALHHLERAERSFAERHGLRHGEGSELRWLAYRLLFALLDVHGDMDHHEERIRYADLITEQLDLDHRASKAWPLLKLGRFDEARLVVEEALASEDLWNRAVARTSLCAIESELRNREAAYEACRLAAEPVRSSERGGAVELTNAGMAAEEMLRFDEAERLYLEAARRPAESSINPWGRLVHLYLAQGRFAEALSAWREMRAYRARRPKPYLDQQDEAEALLAGVAVLLVAGRVDLAEPVVRRVVDRPDRQGTSSAAAEQNEAGAALVARLVRRVRARELEEQAAIAPFFEAIGLRAKAARLRLDAWLVGRQAAEVLAKPERLVTTLRPEVPGSLELPGYLDAEVIGLVGPGVARVALEQARKDETLPEALAAPVFDAYAAEAAWLEGDEEEAFRRGRAAVRAAPRGFTLVAARAAAIAGAAAAALGRPTEARASFREALERDPGVLRVLGIALPVRIAAVSGGVAQEAAELLSGCPAFDLAPWGFRLEVNEGGARLQDVDGSELVEVVAPRPEAPETGEEEDDAVDPARHLAGSIRERLFVPLLDITQVDVRSLEGGLGRGVRASDQIELLQDEERPR